MMINKVGSILVLSSVGLFAMAGCAVDSGAGSEPSDGTTAAASPPPPPPAEGAPTGTTQAALIGGGGGGGGQGYYSCSDIGCICYGDFDCNNMFTDGVCGTRPAKCYERGGGVYCVCYAARTTATTGVTATTATGTVAARAL